MADVNTYSRCTMPHFSVGSVHTEGEVRPNSDAAVTLNPQWWVALSDSVMTSGDTEVQV